jgi:zinc transport system ATP-binding protein
MSANRSLVVNESTPPLISIQDLFVQLGGQTILNGINAKVARGQITAIIGLNGSGKTTLLRTIVGEFPYQGRINFFCGHDHSRPSPENVGYVPQRLSLDARLPLSVRDLFALALSRRPILFGISRRVSQRAAVLMEQVGLPDILDNPVEGLSGGQLQRVLLALALEPSPELLLLDEPAAGIDFKDQQKFYDLISEINSTTGLTVLLVSHDLNMVRTHAHQVLCLKDGRIQCQGPPSVMLTPENLTQTFGATTNLYGLRSAY